MSQILFIGGPADGHRIPDPGLEFWCVESMVAPWSHPLTPSTNFELPHVNRTRYRRDRLYCGDCVWEFYVDDQISPAQAISMLIQSYHPKPIP